MNGRAGGIRTRGLLVPNEALYQAEPRPDNQSGCFSETFRQFIRRPFVSHAGAGVARKITDDPQRPLRRGRGRCRPASSV